MDELREHADDSGDGRWFELLVKRVAPLIPGWEIRAVDEWGEWPDRESVLEESVSDEDNGIDLVARRNDGRWVPIQAKAYAGGSKLAARPVDSFLAATLGNDVWAERWIVTTTDPNRHLRDKLLGLPGITRPYGSGLSKRISAERWTTGGCRAPPPTRGRPCRTML